MLAQKLALVANLRGLSQARLAKDIGVQASHLNHYLKGHGDVRASLLLKILAELGIDVEQLVNQELARLNGLELREKVSPGEAMATMVKSLGDEDRRALLGYVTKFMRTNLGSRASAHVKVMKELA